MCEDGNGKKARASLKMQRGSNGEIVRTWYGRFTVGAKTYTRSLGVRIEGNPPASGRLSDVGDAAFEASRERAQAAAVEMCRAEREKMDGLGKVRYYEKQAERKARVVYEIPVRELVAEYDRLDGSHTERHRDRSEGYAGWKRGVVEKFVAWWKESGRPQTASVAEITREDALAFVDFLALPDENGRKRMTDTLRRMKSYVSALVCELLGVGADDPRNPFAFNLESIDGEETVHREPLTEDQLARVLETAKRTDPLAYELLVTASCTAVRREDACRLAWKSINLNAPWTDANGVVHRGTVRVKTGKTGAVVELPLVEMFKRVVEKRLAERKQGEAYVFPEAVALMEGYTDEKTGKRVHTADRLTRRFKKVLAEALAEDFGADAVDAETVETVPLSSCLHDVLKAVDAATMGEERKKRMVRTLKLHAAGESFNSIAEALGVPKSGISYDLHAAEDLAGVKFLKSHQKTVSMRAKIKAVTRRKRAVGVRCASVLDFHALRTTVATILKKNGVDPETICLVTGHTSTKTLFRHYVRLTGVDMAGVIVSALPDQLTTDTAKQVGTGESAPALSRREMAEVAKSFNPAQMAFLMQLTPDLLRAIQSAEQKAVAMS